MIKKLAEDRINWIPIIVVTIIFSFVGAIVFPLMGAGVSGTFRCMYQFGIMSQTTMFAVGSFLFLMLAYPLRRKFKMSPTLLTCLYISGLVTSWILGSNENPMFPAAWSQYALYSEGSTMPPMTEWWWVPPINAILNMRAGGMPVDWIAWAPSIIFWSWAFFANFVIGLGITLVFRQRWIDVERLAFPPTVAAHEILRRIPQKREKLNMTPFILGIVLGFAFELPIFMANIFPWFPDIYGWKTYTCPMGVQQIHPGNPIGDVVVGFNMVNKDPIAFGAFFLAPLSISFSVMVLTLLMMILEQIAYYMGYYTGIFSCGGCARVYSGTSNLWFSPPFYWAFVFGIGGVLALTTMVFYHSRSYLRETIKAALNRPSELAESQKQEAVGYRGAYITLILGIACLLGFLLSAGIDLLTAFIVMFVTVFANQFASFYVYAHTGYPTVVECGGNWGSWAMTLRFPEGGTQPYSQGFVMSNWLTENWTDVPNNGAGNGLFTTMMSFKMGSLTNMNNKDVLMVVVVCWLLALPTVFITRTWILYVCGARIANWTAQCDLTTSCFSWAFNGAYARPDTFALYGATGFIITVALSLLRARFIWWPIDPIGFVIVTSLQGGGKGDWVAFVGAWVAKTIVLRVGGSKLYEGYGVPLVGGFMGGVAVANLIGVAAGTLRFFYPY
jgi:hypothetical protein